MTPKPKPLHAGEILVGNRYNNNGDDHSSGSAAGAVDVEVFSDLRQQYDEEEQQQQDDQQHRQDVNDQERDGFCQAESVIISAPSRPQRSPSSLKGTSKPKDPNGHLLTRISPKYRKEDPPDGFMMREGDLLDRTFDNVEHFACRGNTTSLNPGPPPPIFACNADEGLSDDIATLSSMKQQGNSIEISEFEETDGHEIGPMNKSILEENSGTNTTSLDQMGPKGNVLDFIFESVHAMMCREDRALSIQPTDSHQAKIDQGETTYSKNDGVRDDDRADIEQEDKNSSLIQRHSIVADPNNDGLANACDHVFTKTKCGNEPETPSLIVGNRGGSFFPYSVQESFSPTPFYENDSKTNRINVPRAGMILLADGTIMAPENGSFRRERQPCQPQQEYRLFTQQNPKNETNLQKSEHSSISMIRENSLLDLEGGSGEPTSEEEDDRLARLRERKRSIEQRVRTAGATHTVTLPQDTYEEEEGIVSIIKLSSPMNKSASPVSVQQLERDHFWKQVTLAATILLVACGLIVFAMSFFWPVQSRL